VTAPERQDRPSVGRRAAIFGGGGLIVGAAAGAGIGLAAAPTSASVTPAQLDAVAKQTPFTENLMIEHGLLIRTILVYREVMRRVAANEPVPRAEVHDATEVVESFIHGFHEPLEEGFVFPPVAKSMATTIDTLLLQHARGREQTQIILTAASGPGSVITGSSRATVANAMDQFVTMYEPHESWEDTLVYPALRAASTATQIVQMATHFQTLENQQFGPNAFAGMLAKVEAVEQAMGLSDLAKFTPAQV
jgi:hemerythrin-like domain-containing protein